MDVVLAEILEILNVAVDVVSVMGALVQTIILRGQIC